MKKILIISSFLLMINATFGQKKIYIAFNESINMGNHNENLLYKIGFEKENYEVLGNKINDFVFKKPGLYQIKTQKIVTTTSHNDEEEHGKPPKDFVVAVDNAKIVFDPKSIQFSRPIRKNQMTSGIVLSINAEIKSYNQQKIKMNLKNVIVAGIGSEITAKPNKKNQILTAGNHIIQYNLFGIVTQNSFLMFDFMNPNGTIQTIALQEAVLN